MKLNPSLYPPKAISSAKQISSTKVDLSRRKTDLVEKRLVNGQVFFLAAGLGFEPRQTESESAVLPLHNPAISLI